VPIDLKKAWGQINFNLVKNWPGWRNKTILFLVLLGLLFNLALWLILVFKIKPSLVLIPTKYNVLLGVTELGKWYQVYRLPAIGFLIYLVNLVLAGILYRNERLASYLLLGFATFVQVLILVAEITLVMVITR